MKFRKDTDVVRDQIEYVQSAWEHLRKDQDQTTVINLPRNPTEPTASSKVILGTGMLEAFQKIPQGDKYASDWGLPLFVMRIGQIGLLAVSKIFPEDIPQIAVTPLRADHKAPDTWLLSPQSDVLAVTRKMVERACGLPPHSDISISRTHAQISQYQGSILICDLSTRNGTQLAIPADTAPLGDTDQPTIETPITLPSHLTVIDIIGK